MTWRDATLGDVITLKRGYDLPNDSRIEGDIPVVSSSGITGYHNEAKIKAPAVVTGRYGTLGEVYYLEQDCWPLNTALYVKDFKGNRPKYVNYFLKNILRGMQSDKAAVPGVNRNDLHARKVIYADSESLQKSIEDLLSPYDELIENNRRRIQLLEDAARVLFKEWFIHLRFPGYEHSKIINGLPEGWLPGVVSDLGQVITGKTPSTADHENFGGNVPFIKTPDMHASPIIVHTEECLSEKGAKTQEKKFIPANSILVACIGAKLGVVSINATEAQTNQQINSVIPKYRAITYYAYFTLKEFRERLLAIGGGATMPNVNKSKFESMSITLPDAALLEVFHESVESSFEQMRVLIEATRKLEQARNLLLPRLMNGDIAV